jgi:phosphoglycerate dehydrogenase-like enzyme
MKALQIALETQYAVEKNLNKIAQIAPQAKIAVFRIQEHYPKIRKIRGLFRRLLPFSAYQPLATYLDPLADAQILSWINPPLISSEINNVLLFPPGLEGSIAEQLVKEYPPQWIHSVTTGVDRILPLAQGAVLSSSKGVHSNRIAEFTLGLIFAMAKNIVQHTLQSHKKIWKSLRSQPINSSRLGIVGLGSIGSEIARLGKAVGMEVWATRQKSEPSPFVDKIFKPEELPILLKESDYVVLSVPLTPKTRHLIGTKELSLMKRSACLINICRGAVIDEDALYDALRHSTIRGACIDVFQDEKPLPRNSRFYQLPNLLITSFSAYFSADSVEQVMDLFFENLRRFDSSEPLFSTSEPKT